MSAAVPAAPALRRKQASAHEDWLRTLAEMRAVPRDVHALTLAPLIRRTVLEIRTLTRGKRVAFGWSGGKDSLALEALCARAGIGACVLVLTKLEYPAFLAWATAAMPKDLTIVLQEDMDLPWLARNPDMLFPRDAQTAARWFHSVQHAGQERLGMDAEEYARLYDEGAILTHLARKDGSFQAGWIPG